MNSLLRIAMVVSLAGLGGCGGEGATPYILDWSTPITSLKSGTTTKLIVMLSAKVKEKTYIDMEISGVDAQWVGTNPDKYIIVGADTDSAEVNITAKTVPNRVSVTINFKIRNTKEGRPLTFQIEP